MAEAEGAIFKYVGGDASLDLVNTVDWTRRGPENEKMDGYGDLLRWAVGAGVLADGEAARLDEVAAGRPEEARAAFERALRLRHVLRELVGAVADGRAGGAAGGEPAEWDRFNRRLEEALAFLRLVPRGTGEEEGDGIADWSWDVGGAGLDLIAHRAVWSAARLLAETEPARLRVCDDPDCGWVYVDRSRNGLRRWCEMETCGTLAKSRRRRERTLRARGEEP